MATRRPTAAERERAEREQAQRQTRLSIRLGGLGVLVLFLSGVGVVLYPADAIGFLGGMVVGILVILVAFFLVRRFPMRLSPGVDRTKLY